LLLHFDDCLLEQNQRPHGCNGKGGNATENQIQETVKNMKRSDLNTSYQGTSTPSSPRANAIQLSLESVFFSAIQSVILQNWRK
jgi:hypothetical protein